MQDIPISTAYEFRPGAVYGLKCEYILNQRQVKLVSDMLDKMEQKTGCTFILIDNGLSVVEPPDVFADDDLPVRRYLDTGEPV